MSNKSYRLLLQSTFEESERIPDFVNELQDECKLMDETAAILMLLLSEAVTYAIIHGNKQIPNKKVEVFIEYTPQAITSTVRDEGDGFKPEAVTPAPLADENLLNVGGRGTFLLQALSDQRHLLDHGTTVRFVVQRG